MNSSSKFALWSIAVSLAAGLSPVGVFAQPDERNPISVSFVASGADTGPGGTAKIGALFDIAPGWHLYWKNPGDSGLPTEVSFTSDSGVDIGEVMFPLPERFELPGGITGNGYEGSALVTADVRIPEKATSKEVTATLRWLGCSEKLCVPGRATQSLELSSLPVSKDRFTAFDGRYPIRVGSGESNLAARLSGALSPDPGSVSELRISFDWKPGAKTGNYDLFIVPPKGYSIESTALEGGAEKPPASASVRLHAESPRHGTPAPLEFLLVRDNGERKGFQGRFTLALGERYERKEIDR